MVKGFFEKSLVVSNLVLETCLHALFSNLFPGLPSCSPILAKEHTAPGFHSNMRTKRKRSTSAVDGDLAAVNLPKGTLSSLLAWFAMEK